MSQHKQIVSAFHLALALCLPTLFLNAEKAQALNVVDEGAAIDKGVMHCGAKNELAALTSEGCYKGLEYIVDDLSDSNFINPEYCAKKITNLKINELFEKQIKRCDKEWTHIYFRKGCKDAARAYYGELNNQNFCENLAKLKNTKVPMQPLANSPITQNSHTLLASAVLNNAIQADASMNSANGQNNGLGKVQLALQDLNYPRIHSVEPQKSMPAQKAASQNSSQQTKAKKAAKQKTSAKLEQLATKKTEPSKPLFEAQPHMQAAKVAPTKSPVKSPIKSPIKPSVTLPASALQPTTQPSNMAGVNKNSSLPLSQQVNLPTINNNSAFASATNVNLENNADQNKDLALPFRAPTASNAPPPSAPKAPSVPTAPVVAPIVPALPVVETAPLFQDAWPQTANSIVPEYNTTQAANKKDSAIPPPVALPNQAIEGLGANQSGQSISSLTAPTLDPFSAKPMPPSPAPATQMPAQMPGFGAPAAQMPPQMPGLAAPAAQMPAQMPGLAAPAAQMPAQMPGLAAPAAQMPAQMPGFGAPVAPAQPASPAANLNSKLQNTAIPANLPANYKEIENEASASGATQATDKLSNIVANTEASSEVAKLKLSTERNTTQIAAPVLPGFFSSIEETQTIERILPEASATPTTALSSSGAPTPPPAIEEPFTQDPR